MLELNKVGRPSKEVTHVKKQLAFSAKKSKSIKERYRLNRYRKRLMNKNIPKPHSYAAHWRPKIMSFLDENSRVMPNKKDTLKLNGEIVAKRHLLCSKLEMYKRFKAKYPEYDRIYSSFRNQIPKNYKSLDLTCRRVCICTKDYNMDEKVNAVNKAVKKIGMPELTSTTRKLSEMTLCNVGSYSTPQRKCVEGQCKECGTTRIEEYYQSAISHWDQNDKVVYHQWESHIEEYISKAGEQKKTTRWLQSEKRASLAELVGEIAQEMETFRKHLFRADFQQKIETDLKRNIRMNECVAVMDFSENISLQAQDEIESAHWAQKQVTLHPIFVVRHSPESTIEEPVILKESLIIISDNLNHDAKAVHMFTDHLLIHLQKNPGPVKIDILHRFTDNCAVQYKCKEAFSHLNIGQKYDLSMIYHYTESGHGKGPSDGLGAAVKKRLQNLILGGTIINNAYQAYLALCQNQNHNLNQQILYVPAKIMKQRAPQNTKNKTITGTQSFHMVRLLEPESEYLVCKDLSCTCVVCIGEQQGPCFLAQYRQTDILVNAKTGRTVTHKDVYATRVSTPSTVNTNTRTDTVECQSMQTFRIQQQKIASSMTTFRNKIAEKGWCLQGDIPFDGNCFFWSLSDQLQNMVDKTLTQREIRTMAVQYIRSLPQPEKTFLEQFITVHLDRYLEKMQKDGTYADHPIIEATAKMLKLQIQVVQENTEVMIGPQSTSPALVIGYIPEIKHYVSLKPISRVPYKEGDFVLVRLKSGSRRRLVFKDYVAEIKQVLPGDELEYTLQYMESVRVGEHIMYKWPSQQDTSQESHFSVVKHLPCPVIDEAKSTTRLQLFSVQID